MNILRKPLILAALMAVLTTNLSHAQFNLRQRRGRKAEVNQTAEQQPSRSDRRGRLTRANPRQSGGKKRDLPKYDFAITGIKGADNALMTTVQNQGFVRSPATTLNIVVKDRITGRVRTTKTARVGPIEPNRVARVRVSPISIGNSFVQVTVDPSNQIAEANEQNNSSASTFAAPSTPTDPNQRADLIVSGLQAKGNLLQIHVTNAGRARSGASAVNVVVRRRDRRLQDTKSVRVSPLKVGGITAVTVRNVVLDNVTVTATVDAENLVPERNERNNTRQITVGNQTEFAPDLKIIDIQFKPQQKEVWFAVRNVGPVAQTQDVSLTVKSFFGPGNLVERSALRVSRLNTGQTVWQRWRVERLNSGMQFEGVLDVSNRLPEQNENNNRRVETF